MGSTGLIGPTSHRYWSQRLRLHYVDWGNPDAPPLLLVHGGRDHCRNWDWVAEDLRHDYHVIAPDLRGHGDSDWMVGSTYGLLDFVHDIATLIRQLDLAPLRIVSHSLGGSISLHYTGLYPESVSHLVAIEGMGPSPKMLAERKATPIAERLTDWVQRSRDLAGRAPRRYATIAEAWERMQAENPHLSAEQAKHLTVHGVNRNEDGTWSWKFDNYVRSFSPIGLSQRDTQALWGRIRCPTLLVRGTESWASDPQADGRAAHFTAADTLEVLNVEEAGHWVHHDQLDLFLRETRRFLALPSPVGAG